METKKCTQCGRIRPMEDYHWKKTGVRRRSECKDCTNRYKKDHYARNREYYIDKAIRRSNPKKRKGNMGYMLEYLLAHPCVDCGETRIPCLQFDHVRGSKRLSVGMMVNRSSLDDLKAEIAKCEVRCANCHILRHAREKGWYKGFDIPEY